MKLRHDEFLKGRLTLFGMDNFGTNGRRQVAKWLRYQADVLEADGHGYDLRFIARFIGTR